MSALFASAMHLATFVGAPVSTTHAIVGAVLGAGVAALGLRVVDWALVMSIITSWVVSPLLGGVIAALFLAFIKVRIIYQDDKIAAARRWVPALVVAHGLDGLRLSDHQGLKERWATPYRRVYLGSGFRSRLCRIKVLDRRTISRHGET